MAEVREKAQRLLDESEARRLRLLLRAPVLAVNAGLPRKHAARFAASLKEADAAQLNQQEQAAASQGVPVAAPAAPPGKLEVF